MAKAKELREISDEQLAVMLRERTEHLFRLRFQAVTERVEAPSEIRRTRREIARIKTILHERRLNRGRDQQPASTPAAAGAETGQEQAQQQRRSQDQPQEKAPEQQEATAEQGTNQ